MRPHQAALLAGETAHAAACVARLQHVTRVLSTIFDNFAFSPDLVLPDEPPEAKRKALRVKLVEELIQQSAHNMPAPPPGRKFALKEWPLLPIDELTAEAAGVGGAEAAPAAEAAPPPAAGGAPPPPAVLSTFLTPAHRSTIASRDRVYATMRTHYHETVRAMASTCHALLREEEMWSHNWAKMTSMLKR